MLLDEQMFLEFTLKKGENKTFEHLLKKIFKSQ